MPARLFRNRMILSPQMENLSRSTRGIGLGDLLHLAFLVTGVHWAVKTWSRLSGRGCGCTRRRDWLNQVRFYAPVLWVPNRVWVKRDQSEFVPTLSRPFPHPPVRPEDLGSETTIPAPAD